MIRAESTVSDKDQWTAKGRATRSRIVEAAARLMHARGVAGTSTEDVLNAAAVSNSQLYHYFADKDDLTRAVIGHQIDQVVGRQEAALARLDSVAALLDWRDAIVSYPSRRGWRGGCPIGSLASELADTDEPARLALTAGFARWQTAIRDGLAQCETGASCAPTPTPTDSRWPPSPPCKGGCCSHKPVATPLR